MTRQVHDCFLLVLSGWQYRTLTRVGVLLYLLIGWLLLPPGPGLFVFGFTAGVAFAFGATADAARLVKQIPGDSAKSQKLNHSFGGGNLFGVQRY